MTEFEALRAEVAALRKELADLRAERREVHHHYHHHAAPYVPQTLMPPVPRPYYPGGPWPVTCVAGRAMEGTFLVNGISQIDGPQH